MTWMCIVLPFILTIIGTMRTSTCNKMVFHLTVPEENIWCEAS